MKIPFVGPRRNPKTIYPDCNLFVVADQSAGAIMSGLYGAPGMKWYTYFAAPAEVRGIFSLKGTQSLYAVCGNGFYVVSTNGAAVLKGNLLTDSGRVQIASNGLQVMVVDGTYGYTYTLATGVFAKIADVDFVGALTLTYQDGYFIVNSKSRFYISAQYDGTNWDALDYAAAEGWPDQILAVFSDHRELWLMGKETCEVWQNTGASAFPFERMGGGYIEEGLEARFAVAKLDNSIVWLSRRNMVVKADGYNPVRISTAEVDYAIAQYAKDFGITDAFAYSYTEGGGSFWVITFPAANATWVYDALTGLWHKRKGFESNGRHRSNCFANFNGLNIVGDYANGKLYALDMDTYFDQRNNNVDDPIERIWTFPPVTNQLDRKYLFHSRLEIECEMGVGLVAGQGSDPQILLSYSDDGEKTWSNEKAGSLGAMGEYGRRVYWNRLGRARSRTYRIRITDPVKVIIYSVDLTAAAGVA